jgi:beta-lactamase class D
MVLMRFILLVLWVLPFSMCAAQEEVASFFKGTQDSCFILYDMQRDKVVQHYETNHQCEKALPPSTNFLMALSLMGYDSGAISNDDHVFRWNGTAYPKKEWEKDQTPASWIKQSVGWVSADLANKLGADALFSYLKKLHYGNADVASGTTSFWQNGGSLKITAYEQLAFIKALSNETLPLSKKAMQHTKQHFFYAENNGWKLMGKPGAGTILATDQKYGWFVGEVSRHKQRYVVVTNIAATPAYFNERCPGCTARRLTKEILAKLGMF